MSALAEHDVNDLASRLRRVVKASTDDLAQRVQSVLDKEEQRERGKKAREAVAAIYIAAVLAAAHLYGKDLAGRIATLLLLAGEKAYAKASVIIGQPYAKTASKTLYSDESEAFALSRQPLLQNFTRTLAGTIEAERAAATADGLTKAKIARRLEAAALEHAKVMVDTETTASCGICQQRVLDKAGFKTVIWSQLDRPGMRESHRENQLVGEVPIGHMWPNNQQYPGDPAGGVGECVNCECKLIGGSR